ncbi:hypothetical protein M422DRAFT_71435 [Sphaerobolus stellatus SS14]|uniref:Unplaced genomic scaffold SPHSTscaffold_235, whole genome shotgun sequence n=1 Tax=Sphaerobolus stellatus (strain SS14) TaxID=990650 RepID=A0A0C9UH37_SPHS4|nr:hypothetical protein M422DRAFT_71435 [Sphaerobolus stellatus SS14]
MEVPCSYIRAPLPEGTLQFTIVAWARQAAHRNGWATIISIENWDWTISTIVWLGVVNAEGGDLKVDLPNNIGNDPDWMHAALVYDVETRKIRLFSNRVDVDHIDLSGGLLHLLSSVNNPLLVVGRNKHEHKRGCAFDGQIGEVRVFQEALDANGIKSWPMLRSPKNLVMLGTMDMPEYMSSFAN